MTTRFTTLALLAVLATGCSTGVSPLAARRVAEGPQAQSLASLPGYATDEAIKAAADEVDPTADEPVPSARQLSAMAAASPDFLVDNPGAEANGTESLFPWPKPPAGDLGNFGKVTDTLFRGARPTDKGLEQLVGMGVKTIVDFENDKGAVEHEQAWCQAHGVTFHSVALSVFLPPKQAKVDQWLGYAEDANSLPLYFHCMQGRDRTGVACLTYRIHHDHWTFGKAYAEMKSYHFHTYLLGLQYYIRHYAASQHAG